MTQETAGHSGHADGFDRASTLLREYPEIDADQLKELKDWFARASSFEVASMASNETLSPGYELFKHEHIDRFTARDWLIAALVLIVLAVVVISFGESAP